MLLVLMGLCQNPTRKSATIPHKWRSTVSTYDAVLTPTRSVLLPLTGHGPLDPLDAHRQQQRHDQVQEGDDVVRFQRFERAGLIELAPLRKVGHADDRDERRIFEHRNEV